VFGVVLPSVAGAPASGKSRCPVPAAEVAVAVQGAVEARGVFVRGHVTDLLVGDAFEARCRSDAAALSGLHDALVEVFGAVAVGST